MVATPTKVQILKALNSANQRLAAFKRAKEEPVAVVGMSSRFPGAPNTEAFWELLSRKRNAITEVPTSRWDIDAYYDPDPGMAGKMSSRYGGFLDGVDRFDAQFFEISPNEARSLDPQQRFLLEVSIEALEHGNQPLEKLSGSATGVFFAVSNFDYASRFFGFENDIDAHLGTGTLVSPAAGRLSYFLGARGPSMVIDTACSSSLVALHQALASLRSRESDLALVGAVSMILSPNLSIAFSKARMLSADGRCKTFDANADGYVRSEGCGVVVLKRLSDAENDRDNILALIRGSAVNQDGASGGLTIPSGPSQEAVIRQALRAARLTPADIDYIESHGTGTSLGDPIEANALGSVFADRETPLIVGSVKTNIGHTEAAAGVASLIKVIMALQHSEIPSHLHFNSQNPHVPWSALPLEIPTDARPWRRGEKPRAAGISSFGFSGTNAHVILSEAPSPAEVQSAHGKRPLHILTLSAKVPAALEQQVEQYRQLFLDNSDLDIADVCFTANCGRTHFRERLALVVSEPSQALEKLTAYQAGQSDDCIHRADGKDTIQVALLFSDEQAANTDGVHCFYGELPVFSRAFDRCNAALRAISNAAESNPTEQAAQSHAELFALEYAQSTLWQSLGAKPAALMGQGVGEYVAACLAGVFSPEEAIGLVVQRERYLRASPDVAEYHLQTFRRSLTKIDFKKPQIAVVSTAATDENRVNTKEYWINQLTAPAAIRHGAKALYDRGIDVFLGLGPGQSILNECRRALPDGYGTAFSTLHEDGDDWAALLEPMAYLHAQGEQIDWSVYHQEHACRGVALPTYPWQHERHWVENKKRDIGISGGDHPILGRRIRSSVLQPGLLLFEAQIGLSTLPYLADHRLYKEVVFPTAGYVEAALTAGAELFQPENSERILLLETFRIEQPLLLRNDGYPTTVQTIVTPAQTGHELEFLSLSPTEPGEWTRHAKCHLSSVPRQHGMTFAHDLSALKRNIDIPIDIAGYYQAFLDVEVDYGPGFQLIRSLHRAQSGEVLGLIELPEDTDEHGGYHLHPLLLDGCLQLLAAALSKADDNDNTYFLVQLAKLSLFRRGSSRLWCYLHRSDEQGSGLLSSFDLHLLDDKGAVIAELLRLQVRRAGRDELLTEHTNNWLYDITWESQPLASQTMTHAPRRWLILSNQGDETGEQLAEQLRERGGRCTLVSQGESFEVLREDHYLLNPMEPQDFDKLFAQVSPSRSSAYDGIIHLWSLDRTGGSLSAVVEDALDSCSGVVHLVQALMRSPAHQKHNPRLCLVTRNAQALTAAPLTVQRAPLWGLGRVILLEHPKLEPLLVDLGEAHDSDWQALLGEILVSEREERQVAYRKGERYVARLERALPSDIGSATDVDSSGTYLVTGGFGSLGLQVARHLVAQGVRHLLLLGRRGAASAAARAVVREFENVGTSVGIVKVDIGKPDALPILRDALEKSGRPLKGVVHAAGVLDDGLLLEQSKERFAAVMAPKVQGAWNLHRLTESMSLDFFVCFSSMSAIIGAIGQANYAAANSFMDALCQHRQAQGLPALSIGWGPWKGTGMASDVTLQSHWDKIGIGSIPPERGVSLFGKLLDSPLSYVGAMPMDWGKYPYENRFFANLKGRTQKDVSSASLLDKLNNAAAEEREMLLIDYLEGLICSILGYRTRTTFSTSQGFFELGMNSLSSLELRNILENDLNCHLPSTLTFDYPTIQKLANYLIIELFEEEIPVEDGDDSTFDAAEDGRYWARDDQQQEPHRQLTEADDPEEIARRLAAQLGMEWE